MSSSSRTDPNIGSKVADRYELTKLIGKGGMGVVYRGVHIATGRPVAVKLLSRDADDAAARRFLREARIAAKVSHPNLVDVIDVGKMEDGGMFLVLELLEGEALSTHIRRKGAMRPEDALDALVPIIDALGALHAAGVVHRDIKPSNIFLSLDGTSRIVPKLLDLGVSKPLDPSEAMTETGMMLGTPHYMSPEQATGAVEVGLAADIWAMGVVLFETLTGDRPFQAETIPGLLHKIATDRPPRMIERMPKLHAGVAAAIDRALAYEPASRHATAAELADALVEAALDAGWTLTCRMPSGPRISLMPFAPAASPADELTPMLGASDPQTPMMSAGTPRPHLASGPSPSEPATPPDRTRDVVAPSIASITGPRTPASVPGTRVTPVRELEHAESQPPITPQDPPPSEPSTDSLTPSERVSQLSRSPLRYAVPLIGLFAAAGIGAWITSVATGGDSDAPARDAAATSNAPVVPALAAPPQPVLTDAGSAAIAETHASTTVEVDRAIEPEEPEPPRPAVRVRNRPRPPIESAPPQPSLEPTPPPRDPPVREPAVERGTNGAPIVPL